eukprot:1920075-Rhodomonas_salina.1
MPTAERRLGRSGCVRGEDGRDARRGASCLGGAGGAGLPWAWSWGWQCVCGGQRTTARQAEPRETQRDAQTPRLVGSGRDWRGRGCERSCADGGKGCLGDGRDCRAGAGLGWREELGRIEACQRALWPARQEQAGRRMRRVGSGGRGRCGA